MNHQATIIKKKDTILQTTCRRNVSTGWTRWTYIYKWRVFHTTLATSVRNDWQTERRRCTQHTHPSVLLLLKWKVQPALPTQQHYYRTQWFEHTPAMLQHDYNVKLNLHSFNWNSCSHDQTAVEARQCISVFYTVQYITVILHLFSSWSDPVSVYVRYDKLFRGFAALPICVASLCMSFHSIQMNLQQTGCSLR